MVGSRRAIENMHAPNTPHAFISIKTPRDVDALLPVNGSTVDILRLAFDDIDPKKQYPDGFQFRPGDVPFDVDMASQVWDFVNKLPDECIIIVHCDAGLSRSPGLAAGLSKILNDDDAEFFNNHYPNMLVYRTIVASHK